MGKEQIIRGLLILMIFEVLSTTKVAAQIIATKPPTPAGTSSSQAGSGTVTTSCPGIGGQPGAFAVSATVHAPPQVVPTVNSFVPGTNQTCRTNLPVGRTFESNPRKPYVCHNYVYETVTGERSTTTKNVDDITNIMSERSYNPQTYNPGTKLPDTLPPGTVIQLRNHVGIIGADGKTFFNYTQPAPTLGIKGELHQDSAQEVWDKVRVTDQGVQTPYSKHPATVWTPPF